MPLRRRRDDEDPLAALRGDGSSPFGYSAPYERAEAVTEPTKHTGGVGRITARHDTGIEVAGVPRVRLTIALEDGKTFEAIVLAAPGSAAEVGDTVDIADGGTVRLRPEIRPAG